MNATAVVDPALAPRPSGASKPDARPTSAAPPADRRRTAVLAALVAVLTLVAFWPVVGNEFVSYDDPAYVYENAQVQRGLTLGGVSWAFTTAHAGNYHPMTWVSLMLDRSLAGAGPAGFHRTNLILHAINSVLLMLVVRSMTGSTWRAAVLAALWAVHPLRVESVAWASERKDVLAAFFGLLTIAAYLAYVHKPDRQRYLALALLFALCVLSKSAWVSLPFVLLLLDFWPLRRTADGTTPALVSLLREKLPLLGISALACVATLVAQSRGDAIGSLDNYPVLERLGNAIVAYGSYLAKIVRPVDLAVFYPHVAPRAAAVVAALAVMAGVTAFAVWRRKQQPALLVGWLWFVGALVPMIGLVQSGAQSMADRFTYMPMIGLLLAACFAAPAAWLQARWTRTAAGLGALLVCVTLVGMTRKQVGHWRDSTTLFEHAIAVTGGNHVAHNSLGFELTRLGRLDEAAGQYEQALRIKPNMSSALNGLGVVAAKKGDAKTATEWYERAVAANPKNAAAQRNLAFHLLAGGGDAKRAVEHLRRAVDLREDDAVAHHLLGVELAKAGDIPDALIHLITAVELDDANAHARVDLGRAIAMSGQPGMAVEHFDAALELDPSLSDAHVHAGAALAQLGQLDASAERLRAALRLSPDDRDAQLALDQVIARRAGGGGGATGPGAGGAAEASVDPAK